MIFLPILVAAQVAASDPSHVVTIEQVRSIQILVPNCEDERRKACEARGGFARAGDAEEVATAITLAARSVREAVLMAVYADWESGARARIISRDGRDAGAWQLRDRGSEALVPARAVFLWRAAEDASEAMCAALPEPERLAALVSGSCDRGRMKARHRWEVSEAIAEEVEGR